MTRKLFPSFVVAAVFSIVFVSLSFAQSRSEAEVFEKINLERSRARLGQLEWDDRLAKVARDYSRQMARQNFFDHYDPEGRTVTDRALSARIRNWSSIGENLFFCEEHPAFVNTAVRGWMRSRTHRKNILTRGWTATGIGVFNSRDGRIFITQVFTSE